MVLRSFGVGQVFDGVVQYVVVGLFVEVFVLDGLGVVLVFLGLEDFVQVCGDFVVGVVLQCLVQVVFGVGQFVLVIVDLVYVVEDCWVVWVQFVCFED